MKNVILLRQIIQNVCNEKDFDSITNNVPPAYSIYKDSSDPVINMAGFIGSTLWLLWLILVGVKFIKATINSIKKNDISKSFHQSKHVNSSRYFISLDKHIS